MEKNNLKHKKSTYKVTDKGKGPDEQFKTVLEEEDGDFSITIKSDSEIEIPEGMLKLIIDKAEQAEEKLSFAE